MSQELHDRFRPLRDEIDRAEVSPEERVKMWRGVEERSARSSMRLWVPALGAVAFAAVAVFVIRPWQFDFDPPQAQWATIENDDGCTDVSASRLAVSGECAAEVSVQIESDRVVMKPGTILRRGKTLRLARGRGRFEVKPRVRAEPFRLAVSAGVITVLGTVFEVEQGDEAGRVDLTSGSIRFDWNDDRQSQTLSPGESLEWGRAEEPPPSDEVEPPPAKRKAKRKRGAVEIKRDLGEALAHVYSLRSQKRYDEAIAVLEETLSEGDFNRSGRAKLSFEIGTLLQLKGAPMKKRCAHWKRHQRRYPGSDQAEAVSRELDACADMKP